jgi:L-fucose mutarotase
MLKGPVLHPALLAGLARAGHGALVLVADANYPASTARGPRSRLVHLNLRPGVVDAVTVLEAVAGLIPVEEATVMAPARSGADALAEDPPIWTRFARVLAAHDAPVPLQQVERHAFYAAASRPDHVLTVVTGETEVYANLLLRVGVVRSP